MEALRTQLDNLQWEIQHLQVENRKLREDHPNATELVDREAEVERASKAEAAMRSRVKSLEEQLADGATLAAESEGRAADAERKIVELEAKIVTFADQEINSRNTEESGATLRPCSD